MQLLGTRQRLPNPEQADMVYSRTRQLLQGPVSNLLDLLEGGHFDGVQIGWHKIQVPKRTRPTCGRNAGFRLRPECRCQKCPPHQTSACTLPAGLLACAHLHTAAQSMMGPAAMSTSCSNALNSLIYVALNQVALHLPCG